MRVESYSELLGMIREQLKPSGFTRRGGRFYISKNGNCGLIDFQKSRATTASEVLFTISVGVASRRLLEFFSNQQPGAALTLSDCHWHERLGMLLPQHKDQWWTLTAQTNIERFGNEIIGLLNGVAIPTIELYSSDEALRDLWLSERSPGLTRLARLLNLAVLLHGFGQKDHLKAVIEELRAASKVLPTSYTIDRSIAKLEDKG